MAAAYASLVSLLNTMDQFQNHPLLSTSFDKYQNESLHENVDFFIKFVENYSDAHSREIEGLVRRVALAAHEAEDVIEVEAADLIRGGNRKSVTLLLNLQRIIEDMNSIKEKATKVEEETELFINSMAPPSAAAPLATTKTCMLGFDRSLEQLLDELTALHSGRRILPIVGMGGIGKTTLAKNVYENSLIVYHFDVRAWVTVSQEYNATQILLQALSCLGESNSKMNRTDDELGEELYKILSGRRYLIVLDDIWSVEAWERIQFFFPENCNRSRILVTTRQQQLVGYFGSSAIALGFLDDKNSWELFCVKTFAHQGCPSELEELGRKIVKKCKGLPLAIIVIGGLLGKSPRTQEYWEKIAEDKGLVLEYSGDEGNKALSILYLSYKNLPVWLKSCFLYLGLFPEDHQIDVSQLIKLLVAEGYIKPSMNQSLEEVAQSYIKELVDRNLLLVGDHLRLNKKFGFCCVHDVVRELCMSIAEKENFYCVQRDIVGKRRFIVDQRTASFYPPESLSFGMPSIMRPLVFHGQRVAPFKSRLLRVLVDDMGCLDPTFQQVNLRFLFHKPSFLEKAIYTCKLPSSIPQCWSLQTLIFHETTLTVVPPEIWKMPQLRHIEMLSMYLPDPPPSDVFVLQNLQTLKKVHNFNLTMEVCRRIPNIKELEIDCGFNEQGGASWCFPLHNVGCLSKLESLNYFGSGKEYVRDPLQNLKLPSSLKELVLWGCHLVWSDMAIIASLPHLQILELHSKAVVGAVWNFVDEDFLCLKHLRIHFCNNLIDWIAESSNFPVLETLTLMLLSQLKEIPSGIGEIPTLEKICVFNCSESVTMSAIKILAEQESLGNEDLQLQLAFSHKTEAEMCRQRIQELGFTCQNLLINDIPL